MFVPVTYNIIPLEVRSNSIDGWEFRLLGIEKEAMMFEADNVSLLWVPSATEFGGTRGSLESNTIGPI